MYDNCVHFVLCAVLVLRLCSVLCSLVLCLGAAYCCILCSVSVFCVCAYCVHIVCILYSMQVHVYVCRCVIDYVCIVLFRFMCVCVCVCVRIGLQTQSDTPHVGILCGYRVRIIKYKKTQPLLNSHRFDFLHFFFVSK